jgi:hypothetical protein
VKTPALTAWRAELARGARTRDTFDWLWRAACWEMAALEADQDGMHRAAREHLRQARKIVAAAAATRGAA